MKTPGISGRRVVLWLAAGTLAGSVAFAGDPAPAQPQPAAATVPQAAKAVPLTQEQLLEQQAKHADRLFVLDVRTPAEFAEGHVPGAVNIPHDQVAARIGEVPRDKDVVLYCKSGRRAGLAADVLTANGYTRLKHLEGDMTAWAANGRPVEK